ncbi:MAG: hypothetical protein V4714_04955 [Bacteroidota bacterium]
MKRSELDWWTTILPCSLGPICCWLLIFLLSSCRYQTGEIMLPNAGLLIIPTPPTVALDSALTRDLPVRFYGTLLSQGADTITRYGFCYSSMKALPTVADSLVADSAHVSALPFAYTLDTRQLKRATIYYARAFAANQYGVSYNKDVLQFTIPDNRTTPTVTTNEVENITLSSANSKSQIMADGQSPITAYGICYSDVNSNPGLSDKAVITGTAVDGTFPFAFAQALEGLAANKTYYVRAFATNSLGTAFGTTKTFKTTTVSTSAPIVQTDNVQNVTINSASVDATISAKGSADITRYGICFSNSNQNPTISDPLVVVGTTSPNALPFIFAGNLTGLTAGTTYYVRSFATNSIGTSYGVMRSFRTSLVVVTPASVQTNAVLSASINTTTAQVSGIMTAKGTANITQYGFCYSGSNANPTTTDAVLVAGNTSPSSFPFDFSGTLAGLTAGSAYYVRAYAVSSAGISYGISMAFRTVAATNTPPGVQTVNVSNISFTSAQVLGNLTSRGTADITEYGIAYSTTNANPTTADSKVVVGNSSSGSFPVGFTGNLIRLVANTFYYVRAYAINSAGTSYGSAQRFSTLVATPNVTTDRATFDIATNSVTAHGTIQGMGASAITRYGFCYSKTNASPTIADNPIDVGTSVSGAFPFSFSNTLLRLTAGNYYVRAFAGNASGIAYGSVISVTVYVNPAVTTDENITKDASLGLITLTGNIVSGGSTPVLEYGFAVIPTANAGRDFQVGDRGVTVVRRTSPIPTSFSFRYQIDATVNYNVDYSYKAYVKTANGIVYGSVKTFLISYKP